MSKRPFAATLIVLSLFALACNTTRPTAPILGTALQHAQAAQIREAGQRLGVPVQLDRMTYVSQANAALLTAPVQGLENVPATALPNGVDVAVAYLDSPGQRYPAGYYRLRGVAQPREPGTVQGTLQVIDSGNTVVAELPARYDIVSMRVPDRPVTRFTDVIFASSRLAGHCAGGKETCYCCPNGWIVCTGGLLTPVTNVIEAAIP